MINIVQLIVSSFFFLFIGSMKCQNKESYCNAVYPDCSTSKVKRDCKKYCGLCQSSICANEESWCDFARPDCSTSLAQKSYKKLCGLCGGNFKKNKFLISDIWYCNLYD